MTEAKYIEELQEIFKHLFPKAGLRLEIEASQQSVLFLYSAVVYVTGVEQMREFSVRRVRSASEAALSDIVDSTGNIPGDTKRIPVLVAGYFSSASQDILRTKSLFFADSAGNAWIDTASLLIDKRGFRPIHTNQKKTRTGIFSDKASLVLRILLERDQMGVREMHAFADKTGFDLSPGYISKVLNELAEIGYSKRVGDKFSLRRKQEMLNDWSANYKRLNRVEKIGYYFPAEDAELLIPKLATLFDGDKVEYLFTDHAGASLVDRYASFDSVDVSVKDLQAASSSLEKMGAKVVERGANINVFVPYYAVSGFYGAQEVKGVNVASNIQLYLDLLCQPRRGLEQSEHLYNRYLALMFEEDN